MKGIEKSSRALGPRRFSMVQLLIALALLFFFVPFVEEIKGGDLIVSALLSLVLLAGVLAVASRGRTLAVAVLLAILRSRADGSTIFNRTWFRQRYFSSQESAWLRSSW